MSDEITVLLADDHTLVRRGFRRLLEDDPDIQVVGEASDGEEVRKALNEVVRWADASRILLKSDD